MQLGRVKTPTRAVCAEYIALRSDICALVELQKQVAKKQGELALLRQTNQGDDIITPTAAAYAALAYCFVAISGVTSSCLS